MHSHEAWMEKSLIDLKVSKALFTKEFFGPVVYHCQQCAEKAFKGYLAAKGQKL